MRRSVGGSILVFLFLWSTATAGEAERAKYVFLFIGDGMGPEQVAAAQAARGRLVMTSLPEHGTCTTHSATAAITDSSAAGTALACGVKTANGHIAMDVSGKRCLPTIAEQAKAAGQRVGVMTSVSIDHATPACFYAHDASRNNYHAIAMQLAPSGFDYFAGGGFWGALPEQRKDGPDPLATTTAAGYTLVRDRAALMELKPGTGKVLAIHPNLSDKDASMPWVMEALPEDPTLADYTAKGIELLENPAGFFFMIEGGKIDWAGHANDLAGTVTETLAFDDAIAKAVAFAEMHPDETLIVVTADHETGGLAPLTGRKTWMDLLDAQTCAKDEARKRVAAALVGATDPLAAVLPVIRAVFGLEVIDAVDRARLETIADTDPTAIRRLALALTPEEVTIIGRGLAGKVEDRHLRVVQACMHILATKAGFSWSLNDHTATPVPVYARGIGAKLFAGVQDNTELSHRLAAVMGLALAPAVP